MSEHIDTRDGTWREVPMHEGNTIMQLIEYDRATDEPIRGWVREHPVPALPTEPTEEDADAIVQRLSELLDGVARALKGDPPPLTMWSFHDLPELAAQVRRETARAVLDRAFKATNMQRDTRNIIAREFGVDK